jgi:hypothetical protein
MPRRILICWVGICLLSMFFVSVISADDLDHISVEGVITDAAQQRIVNAKITIKSVATTQERNVTSNGEGHYRFTSLLPGAYELRIEVNGFRTVQFNFTASAGTKVRRDFKLEIAALAEQIIVESATEQVLIDTSRTVVGGTITARQIDDLPTESRNINDLIFTLPGVAPPAFDDRQLAEGDTKDRFRTSPEEAGVFALNGGTPFSNNLTIEGLDNNDDRGARERFTPSVDAVEEFQVITNQFSAEYGRAAGGRINLRLRSGGNKYRGRAFYYFRDEALNANTYVRNADPTRGFRLPYQNNNPGLTFGGPILRRKLFFFSAYEYDNIYDRTDIIALVPVGANAAFALQQPNGANLGSTAFDRTGKPSTINGGAAVGLFDQQVTTPRTAHTFQTRTDFNVGEKQNLFAVASLARQRDERSFPGGRRMLDTLRTTGRNSESIALVHNITLSAHAVNQARFQFSRLTPADAPLNANPVVIIDMDDPRDVIGSTSANPLTRAGTLLAGSSNSSGTDRRETRYQMQDTFSVSLGKHNFRTGIDWQVIRSRFVDLGDVTGTFRFASPADFLASKTTRYTHRFLTSSELNNTYTGWFAQDDMRLKSNLTVAVGLRWDVETILADNNNLGPRVALAWDPFSSGKTAVRAGAGIFYNRALLRTLDDYVLTSNKLLVDTDNPAAAGLLTSLRFPNVLSATDPRVALLGVKESGFTRRTENGFRVPESYQASLGIEREFSKHFTLEATYVFSRGLHLWRESNANAPRLPTGVANFTAYLTSRDFDNAIDPATGQRPITSSGNADVARFDLSQTSSRTVRENNKTVVIMGLNNQSISSTTTVFRAALAAVRPLRPNPNLTQVEELQARGNSYYHGANFQLRSRLAKRAYINVAYTLSKLIDDGTVNTSSPLIVGDFASERALSLLDARHRVAVSGSYEFPRVLGSLNLAGIFTASSSRPFALGIGGNDRNLDDVGTDRPNFTGDLQQIGWRKLSEPLDQNLVAAFSLPTIGSVGNLPRNAGRGPGQHTINLRGSRVFNFGEGRKVTPQIEVFNPLNQTIFNFGAEFVDFAPTSLGNFLAPARTLKARTMRLGLRFDF